MRATRAQFVCIFIGWTILLWSAHSWDAKQGIGAFLVLIGLLGMTDEQKKAPPPPCDSTVHDHDACDPCVHCGHPTDRACGKCYRAHNGVCIDVCSCCDAIHDTMVHVARGMTQ